VKTLAVGSGCMLTDGGVIVPVMMTS
jgi:hypothetical protein